MNFIKNFGATGSKSAQGAASSSKSAYFKPLDLGNDNPKQKVQEKSKKVKGPPKSFIPEKYALDFDKPAIIMEYRDGSNQKLYHHRMAMKKLKKQTPTKEAFDYIKKRHKQYFAPKVIDEAQIQKLIDRLKSGMLSENQKMGDVEEEDFDFDYEDDFDI